MQWDFGAGDLIANRTDVSAPTPSAFGIIQDIEFDFDFTLKELYGQNQFAVDVARGAAKVTGKAKTARISGALYNDVYFGQVLTANAGNLFYKNEAHSVPGSSTYTVTVTNVTNGISDEGVYYAVTGVQLQRVAPSSEATGKYSVNLATGVYTFAAGDAAAALLFNYYNGATTGTESIAITNELMGSGPLFQVNLATTFRNKIANIQLYRCTASKLSFPFKNQDYMINDFEFTAMQNDAGNVGILTFTE